MKKARFLFILSLMFMVLPVSKVFADSWDYLPGGANYLNEDIFVLEDSWYSSTNPFVIKPDTDFVLTMSDDYHRIFGGYTTLVMITYYNNSSLVAEEELIFTDFLDNPGYLTLSTSFHSPVNANKMSISFLEEEAYFELNGLSQMMLEEGTVFTAFEDFIYGTLIDTASPEFLNVNEVISYVHSPISVEDIKDSLQAYDTIDGNLSSLISVKTDNYSAHNDTLGLYSIVFEVNDLSGNHSEASVNVRVVDVLKPVFSTVETIVMPYPQTYSIEDIKALLSASDNYDGDISSSIELLEDLYTTNQSVVGNYTVSFKVEDSSGNSETTTVSINVVDNEAPVISGIKDIVIGYDETITTQAVISQLSAIDNYDSSLSFVIVSNNYTDNRYNLGLYEILVSVTDTSGNITYETVSIEVVDEIGPILYFDSSIIQTYQDYVLSLEDFIDLLSLSSEFTGLTGASVEVLYDSYSNHATIPGIYHVKLLIHKTDSETIEKDFQITVKEDLDYIYNPENVTQTFFEQNFQLFIIGGLGFIVVLTNIIWFMHFKRK